MHTIALWQATITNFITGTMNGYLLGKNKQLITTLNLKIFRRIRYTGCGTWTMERKSSLSFSKMENNFFPTNNL